MKYRKLRIAFSAVCGIVCLLLIVLWVQGYRNTGLISSLPFAFPTLILFVLTVAPWASAIRFSLRTLLIGMTLVAALLGAVVWAVR